MNKNILVLFVLWLLAAVQSQAQVSHGGKPLDWEVQPGVGTRSMERALFVELPAFDVAQELHADSLNERDLRSGYRFAYKFMTDYHPGNSGTRFTLPDGTRVWRLGIRSAGALSLNLLFTEYRLPEGAQVFVYTPDRKQILGAFNHLNNSELGLLPVAPLTGDELIVEYQEPDGVAFRGELAIGEVNHGYRSLRGDEPRPDQNSFRCIPPLSCFADGDSPYQTWGRSVVMMLIDGNIACTGTLVNNTANDGKPYLLTASHCLNRSFRVDNPDYQRVAGRIVCFFNYNSPLCNPVLRGAEELSVASARCHAVNEATDMALLELLQPPPAWYQPYYAGWNASPTPHPPYAGIHHPGGTVKRIGWAEGQVTLETFQTLGTYFNPNSHWHVAEWAVGCTAGGSSGSPLFDAGGSVIGALSGGSSRCGDPIDDYYYALHRSWTASEEPQRQLRHWLDPAGQGQLTCPGLDPYAPAQCYRLSNVSAGGHREAVETTPLSESLPEPRFGNNSLGVAHYAEAYTTARSAKLHGAYFVTPATTGNDKELKVEVTVYSGSDKPQTLLHTEAFRPAYQNMKTTDSTFQHTAKPLNRAQESYIHFAKPVAVEGTFYIGYRITASQGARFSVYNTPKGATTRNTAWAYYRNQWVEATTYTPSPFNTSLYIDPVLQYESIVATAAVEAPNPVLLHTDGKTLHVILPDAGKEAHLSIVSLTGKTVSAFAVRTSPCRIPVDVPSQGIYIVNIEYGGLKYAEKIIF